MTLITFLTTFLIRDRFYKIRSLLKVVNAPEVPEEEKKKDPLWKVRPVQKRVYLGQQRSVLMNRLFHSPAGVQFVSLCLGSQIQQD